MLTVKGTSSPLLSATHNPFSNSSIANCCNAKPNRHTTTDAMGSFISLETSITATASTNAVCGDGVNGGKGFSCGKSGRVSSCGNGGKGSSICDGNKGSSHGYVGKWVAHGNFGKGAAHSGDGEVLVENRSRWTENKVSDLKVFVSQERETGQILMCCLP